MYDVSQFRFALYALLMLGTVGFAQASESPGTFVLASLGILSNAWLVYTGRFFPMPRLLANVLTLGSTVFVVQRLLTSGTTPVLVIGQFLVFLQLVKLWEQRANRDYAQLLILSLLLMVAAAISTPSLVFGLLLVIYLFLSLYCCLLFHLKVESDSARAALALPESKISASALRRDQQYLSSSMRRLTAFVAGVSILTAIVIFLFFPRGAGAGLLGPMQFQAAQTLTGFSDTVGFQKIAQIQQNQEIMAYMKVWKNNELVKNGRTILLRGTTLDRYTGEGGNEAPWQWIRSPGGIKSQFSVNREELKYVDEEETPPQAWRQHIVFRRPTGTDTLFAMDGIVSIRATQDIPITYYKHDGVLQSQSARIVALEYEVVSRAKLDPPSGVPWAPRRFNQPVNPRIEKYARKAEVSGSDGQGPFAARRPFEDVVNPLDEAIAMSIEQHLQSQFTYSLDLTDARDIMKGQDPLAAFLWDLKRGHCEYFAGAMALMCQSLGMQARVVTGFKCDEFNEFSEQYVVRQSHAHAWVEVRTADGWKTFDPTSGRELAGAGRKTTLWQKVKHIFNFLEFKYATSVIAFDNDNQESLVRNVETSMNQTAWQGAEWLNNLREWIKAKQLPDLMTAQIYLSSITAVALATVCLLAYVLVGRYRLRKRAVRIGLQSLPAALQARLVRQLGFYDDLIQLLGRHGIHRAAHVTPLEFSKSLLFLPAGAYATVNRLTRLFYRIRFGDAQLSDVQYRRLHVAVTNVASALGPAVTRGK